MPTKSRFKPNNKYGVEDINDTIAILAGDSGVVFTTGNSILGQVTDAGVSYKDGRLEIKLKQKQSNPLNQYVNLYNLSDGLAIMADGSQFIVYGGSGVDFEVSTQTEKYVYIQNSTVANENVLTISDVELTGDVLLLAIIKTDGSVEDKRVFARSKVEKIGNPSPIVLCNYLCDWARLEQGEKIPWSDEIATESGTRYYRTPPLEMDFPENFQDYSFLIFRRIKKPIDGQYVEVTTPSEGEYNNYDFCFIYDIHNECFWGEPGILRKNLATAYNSSYSIAKIDLKNKKIMFSVENNSYSWNENVSKGGRVWVEISLI